jgi:hypothetical protein
MAQGESATRARRALLALGAASSPALGGWIGELAGFPVAFVCLGALSLISLGLWLGFAGLLRPACALEPAGAA